MREKTEKRKERKKMKLATRGNTMKKNKAWNKNQKKPIRRVNEKNNLDER